MGGEFSADIIPYMHWCSPLIIRSGFALRGDWLHYLLTQDFSRASSGKSLRALKRRLMNRKMPICTYKSPSLVLRSNVSKFVFREVQERTERNGKRSSNNCQTTFHIPSFDGFWHWQFFLHVPLQTIAIVTLSSILRILHHPLMTWLRDGCIGTWLEFFRSKSSCLRF